MGRRRSRAAWAAVVAVALVAGGLLVPSNLVVLGKASGAPSIGASSIYVSNTGAYSYTPDTFENLPTYTNITVTFIDNLTEVDVHTFTIIGEEGVQLPSDTSQEEINELSFGNSPPPLFNLNVSGPGDRNVSTFESPGPGWYEFLCSQVGHFALGMYGFIAFGMDLPSNLTLPDRASIGGHLVFNLADGAVIAGGLIVLALAVLVWYRRPSARRGPPSSAGRARPPTGGDR